MRRGRRWSAASRSFLALALVLGGAAFLLVHGYAARVDALAPAIGPSVPVAIAARPLTRGTTVSADMLRLVEMPAAYAPPGALRRVEDGVGRTLVSDLAAREPITRTRLGSSRAGPLASLVPAGMRAMNVPVTAGLGTIHPGDRVDVLATFGGGQPHTETVGTGLEVIRTSTGGNGASSTSSSTDGTGGGGPTLTVLVTPAEAEQLAYASAFAELSVAILGEEDWNTTSP
ncbi:MAG: Flp pilus assembly protein CpaB [Actinomycetota bacterium]|nr:Flp pilus assembly protein CpaB [Actinomycetota bacterium]